ncbi:MAG: hypothetical protein LBD04_02870 [Synergistaceae bacterium]|jgi:hypothetical protein|nr:hypothetical protein [Synergistaceae bacterium]
MYHSHTNVTPPSIQDFQILLNENVYEMGVISYNQDVFIVRPGDGWLPTESEYREIAAKIRKEVDHDVQSLPNFAEWSFEERTYVAIREQAYRIARYFEWKMYGGSIHG